MPLPLTQAQRTLPTTRAASGPPVDDDPAFLDTVRDAFTSAEADGSNYIVDTRHAAYRPLMDAMEDLGHPVSRWVNPAKGTLDYDSFYAAVLKEKGRGHFADLPETMAEFEQQWRDKDAQRIAAARARAEAGGFLPNLIGGVGGAMTDPANIYTLPVGGAGKTITTRLLTEGLVGAGVETLLQPGAQRNREELGLPDLTAQEAAANIGFAGLGGAAFRGAIEVAPTAARKLGENIAGDWQRTRDYLWPRLPEAVRARLGSKEALQPEALPDLAEEIIGPERMTQAERDAMEVARDSAELANSPLRQNGAGQQLHRDLIGEAMDRLIDMAPPSTLPVRSAAGGAAEVRPGSRAGRVSGGNAFGDATAEARFMGRVRQAESGGVDTAKNPRSSATGRYQFIDSTWVRQYVKRYGRGGLSDEQILAKRGNGALQDQLMKDLTAENAAFLRSQGEAVTEGNLYLVHFGGAGGARKVFEADPSAPIEQVWSAAVIKANPFLRGMTAGDVISWAHRKMGMQGNSPRAGAGYQLAEGEGIDGALAREAQELDTIRRTLDEAYAAEDAARRAALGESDSAAVTAALARDVEPRGFDEADPFDEAATSPLEQLEPSETPEQAALRSQLADLVHDTKESINDIAGLAKRFEASESDVRAALNGMAARGTIAQNRKTGNFMRKPGKDEGELLETVARYGGLRDDEGHALGLTGLSRSEARELTSSGKQNTLRQRKGKGRRDWNGIMTRSGPLLRHEGRSVDEIGEALWDEGWFTERPTTAQVLDLIEQRVSGGKKMYPPGHQKSGSEPDLPDYYDEWEAEWQQAKGDFLSEYTLGRAFDDEQADLPDDAVMARAAEIYAEARAYGDEFQPDAEQAVMQAVDEEYARVLEDLAIQDMKDAYGTRFDIFDPDHRAELDQRIDERRRADGERGSGRPGEAGNARSRGPSGADDARTRADAVDPQRLAELDPEQRAPFSDPDSDAAKQQADSLVHDMRAEQERFDSVWKDPEFKKLMGPVKARPHRESGPAADVVDGWLDGKAASDLYAFESHYGDLDASAMQPRGFNPVRSYAEAFYAAVMGKRVEIRTIGGESKNGKGERVIDLAIAQRELDSELTGRAPAEGEPALPGNFMMRQDLRRPAGERPSVDAEAQVKAMRKENKQGAMVRKDTSPELAREYALGWDAGRANEPLGADYTNNVLWSHGHHAGRWYRQYRDKKPMGEPQRLGGNPEPVQADFAAPTQDQRRIELERQTEGRMKGKGPQKAAGADGGLFDTQDTTGDLFDAPEFLLDADGEAKPAADLMADLDAEEADLTNIKDCL